MRADALNVGLSIIEEYISCTLLSSLLDHVLLGFGGVSQSVNEGLI